MYLYKEMREVIKEITIKKKIQLSLIKTTFELSQNKLFKGGLCMFGLVPFKFNNGANNRGLSINDMFNDFFNDDMLSEFKSCGSFKTDIKETPEEYVVHAELPGVKKEDINIDYNNNYLSISATRNNEFEEKKDNYIRRERSYGSVSRGFYINNVNKEAIKAKFDNGVLTIDLPKKEISSNNDSRILIE